MINTTTETKDFWVNSSNFESIKKMDINKVHATKWHNGIFELNCTKKELCTNKITISWEVPDRVITISESEFDTAALVAMFGNNVSEYAENIKSKLFGGK